MSDLSFWGVVPARGGSKTIRLKNLVQLGDRPLLDYGVLAAKAWGGFQRIFCSSDDGRIIRRAIELGVEVDQRPEHLAGDDIPVAEVVRDFLRRKVADSEHLPSWLFLIQPTSPFVLPEHFAAMAAAVRITPAANSAQTVTEVPHNHHAWNQRVVQGGRATFLHATKRAKGYNKQSKPQLFVFGNLVAVRVEAIMAGKDFFATPSLSITIPRPYDLDVDGPADLCIAQALLAHGEIGLPHL